MDSEQKKEVGKRIKDIRLARGETAEEFGKHFDPIANRGLVSGWENGRYLPSPERLEVISKLGRISVKYLIEGSSLESFTQNLSVMAESMTKEERFSHVRNMVELFANLDESLKSGEEFKDAPSKNKELALDFNKVLTEKYINTLLDPEEIKEWEAIYLPDNKNNPSA